MSTWLWASACGSDASTRTPSSPAPSPVASAAMAEPSELNPDATASSELSWDDEALLAVRAHGQFARYRTAPLRQYVRGNRTVLVVWPALNPDGTIIDDDTIAVTLERDVEGALSILPGQQNVMRMSTADLHNLLGGADYQVFPPAGASLDELGTIFATTPARFSEALRGGDTEGALSQVAHLAALYAPEDIAALDNVAEILISVHEGRFQLAFEGLTEVSSAEARVEITLVDPSGTAQPVVFNVRAKEGRWLIAETTAP